MLTVADFCWKIGQRFVGKKSRKAGQVSLGQVEAVSQVLQTWAHGQMGRKQGTRRRTEDTTSGPGFLLQRVQMLLRASGTRKPCRSNFPSKEKSTSVKLRKKETLGSEQPSPAGHAWPRRGSCSKHKSFACRSKPPVLLAAIQARTQQAEHPCKLRRKF